MSGAVFALTAEEIAHAERIKTEVNTFAIVCAMARERGLSPADVRSPKRHSEFVRCRVAISRHLRAKGYSLHEIARALGRSDHTSVMYYLGQLKRPAKGRQAHQAVNP